jgi:hypothetical protein
MKVVKHAHTGREIITCVPRSKIKMTEMFNANDLIKAMHDWIVDAGFGPRSDKDFPEVFYLHRFLQQSGEEVKLWWQFNKPVNAFFKYEFFVDILMLGLKQTEVMQDGMKFKSNQGYLEVCTEAYLELDPDFKWRKHWLMKQLFPMFKERMFSTEIDRHRVNLVRFTNLFRTSVKNYFQLKGYHAVAAVDEEFNYRQDFR